MCIRDRDIVEIDRIKDAINKNERFLHRLFTDNEIKYFESKGFKTEKMCIRDS